MNLLQSKKILCSVLEKEDDLVATYTLLGKNGFVLEILTETFFETHVPRWVHQEAIGLGSNDEELLILAQLMPGKFLHCFHYLIIALKTKDSTTLEELCFRGHESKVLAWLENNYPTQVEEAMAMIAETESHANSEVSKEHFEAMMRLVRSRKSNSDTVS